jgi:hypothetical protein
MNITSRTLKTALMHLYRFKKGYLVVTEFSYRYGIADILTLTKAHEIIEVEVKVSKFDLLSELTHKQEKHALLRESNRSSLLRLPNRFFFCVPTELVEVANAVCEQVNPNYGIIAFDGSRGLIRRPYDLLSVVRKSHKLHKVDMSKWFHEDIMKRMNNDLVKMYTDRYWQ